MVEAQFVQSVQNQPREDQECCCSNTTNDSVPGAGGGQELPVPIVNSELDEIMEFAYSPSNLPFGAKPTSSSGRRRRGELQISNRLQVENLALRHQLAVLR